MVHDLYQEIILDHSKRPRNCHAMADATRQADGYNPLCGDKLKLFVKVENDIVVDVSFVGSGCAISTASASMMTESLKGKTREEALKLLVEAQARTPLTRAHPPATSRPARHSRRAPVRRPHRSPAPLLLQTPPPSPSLA